ncbi:hypothetical protein CL631_02210 [bacterium]|nr:hypothetical protein [bacterium]|tara:strand:+ start:2167 stop:2514 length:348 start_codon:yes stop_codon:yes gene_type:complete
MKKKPNTSITPAPKFAVSPNVRYVKPSEQAPKQKVVRILRKYGGSANLGSDSACEKIAVDILTAIAMGTQKVDMDVIEDLIELGTNEIEIHCPTAVVDEWFKLLNKYWKSKEKQK